MGIVLEIDVKILIEEQALPLTSLIFGLQFERGSQNTN